jgi:hypothetical protein
MKYGEYNINYSTGVPNISVPLYEINHHGFKIPVALSYYHQGLKPGYNVDVFGLGWGVNPTGKISREIRYRPDERSDFVVDVINPYVDTYNAVSSAYSDPTQFNHSSDLFHVALPSGISFDFTVEKVNGNYKTWISTGEPVIINVLSAGNNFLKTWEIIDKDGVKYTFLASDGEEVQINSSYSQGTISTWNLSRIDLPNSNEPIIYTYRKGVESSKFTKSDIKAVVSTYNDSNNCFNAPQPLNYRTDFLDKINYGKTYIKFIYNTEPNSSGTYDLHNFIKSINIAETGGALIKKVNFEMSNLGYKIPLYSIPLMRLNSITISAGLETLPPKTYNLEYNPISSFGSANTDHWGYLNNRNSPLSGSSFPDFHIYLDEYWNRSCYDGASIVNSPYNNTIEWKLGNGNKHSGGQHGMLSKIIYPTGGYTVFSFEKNIFEVKTKSDFRPWNSTEQGAGFRIAEIANYTSQYSTSQYSTLTSKTIYKYGKLLGNGSNGPEHTGAGIAPVEPNALSYLNLKSFGLPLYNYNYFRHYHANPNIVGIDQYSWEELAGVEYVFDNAIFRSILNGRPAVVYPDVTVYKGEFRKNGYTTLDKTLGKTVYKYDYLDYEGNFIEPWEFEKDGASYYIPKAYRYNKLIEQVDYKREDLININSQKTESVYTPTRKIENKWHYSIAGAVRESHKLIKTVPNIVAFESDSITRSPAELPNFYSNLSIYEEPYIANLYERISTEYINVTDSIQTKENMRYNNDGFLIWSEIENSNNKKTISSYTYPNSYTGGNTPPVIEKMKNDSHHIISPVIGSYLYLKEGSTETFVSGTKTSYKEFTVDGNILIMPEKQISIDKSNTGTTELTILSYTTNGKAKEVMGKDGVTTSYLWGYNDRYPVVKVYNATINQVEATLNTTELTNIKNGSYDRAAMISTLNKIRTGLSGNYAMVSSYTYNYLGGMTSMTDPLGNTTYYEYDEFNRLIQVKDADGNIISQNKYKYKD